MTAGGRAVAPRILMAENDLLFMAARAEFLEQRGYTVIQAADPAAAVDQLENGRIHLAVLDIRLENDDDELDISGLTIAADPRFRSIPKIILTNFPRHDTVRMMLKHAAGELPPAVDYVTKAEGPEAMIHAVAHTLQEYGQRNAGLEISWNPRQLFSLPALVSLVDGAAPVDRWAGRVGELEDLFRQVFLEGTHLYISQLLWSRAGCAALEVLISGPAGGELQLVVCGLADAVQQEAQGYRQWQNRTRATGSLAVTAWRASVHYALFTRLLPVRQPSPGDLTTLAAAFHRGLGEQPLQAVVANLFCQQLEPWLAQGRVVDPGSSLFAWYRREFGFDPGGAAWTGLAEKLAAFAHLCLARGFGELSWSDGRVTLTAPGQKALSVADPLAFARLDPAPSLGRLVSGFSCGGLDPETVLFDPAGNVYLSRFAGSERRPVWDDLAALECTLRFEWLAEIHLINLDFCERRLLQVNRLGQPLPGRAEKEYRRLEEFCQDLRVAAARLLGDDLGSYLVSLFFHTLSGLSAFVPGSSLTGRDLQTGLYRILLAGLLAEKLAAMTAASPPAATPPAGGGTIRIDRQNHEVWLGDEPVALAPREYELLVYLEQHEGQLCTRQQISREVIGSDPTISDEEALINSTVRRLRRKIEADSSRPVHLITVRGVGYRFYRQPHGN